jgi:hypothetical protein
VVRRDSSTSNFEACVRKAKQSLLRQTHDEAVDSVILKQEKIQAPILFPLTSADRDWFRNYDDVPTHENIALMLGSTSSGDFGAVGFFFRF